MFSGQCPLTDCFSIVVVWQKWWRVKGGGGGGHNVRIAAGVPRLTTLCWPALPAVRLLTDSSGRASVHCSPSFSSSLLLLRCVVVEFYDAAATTVHTHTTLEHQRSIPASVACWMEAAAVSFSTAEAAAAVGRSRTRSRSTQHKRGSRKAMRDVDGEQGDATSTTTFQDAEWHVINTMRTICHC